MGNKSQSRIKYRLFFCLIFILILVTFFIFALEGSYTGDSFSTHKGGNNYPQGITQNNTYIWIVDDIVLVRKNNKTASPLGVPQKSELRGIWSGNSNFGTFFNGQNYIITDLYINRRITNYIGLFGVFIWRRK